MIALALALLASAGSAAPVRGDFDRDGRLDTAELVDEGPSRSLVVRLAGDKVLPLLASIGRDEDFHMALAARGERLTACGKGMGGDEPCARRSVRIDGDVLAFGTAEASEAVALWNGRSFDIVWLSD